MTSHEMINLLLIEDEEFDVRRIRKTLQPVEKRVRIRDVVSNGKVAIELLEKNRKNYDVVIMDFQIAGGLMGENLIRRIKEIDATLQIIVVTKMTINMTDFDFANKLLEAGAMWYCTKYPGDIEEYIYQPTDFVLSIFNAFEKKKLERDRLRSNQKLQETIEAILAKKQLIGESPVIQTLLKQIKRCAELDTNILLQGDSGTGKELVAANIHYQGRRRFENFVPINCGSLPENLIESELFGFEKGSFTGASTKKLGLFEIASKGTIFLDEITELPASAQSTLLRVIQEGEIDKIGRTEKVAVDVRIIAATNQDLEKEVREKRFREDLYYRLNVVSLYVPPLNQRKEDIPLLIDHFLQKFCQAMSIDKPLISPSAVELLINHTWRGNVRELQNVVQRLLFLGGRELTAKEVRLALGGRLVSERPAEANLLQFWEQNPILPLRDMELKLRREYFQFIRQHTQSNAEAARKLGLAPSNFHRMCKEMGL